MREHALEGLVLEDAPQPRSTCFLVSANSRDGNSVSKNCRAVPWSLRMCGANLASLPGSINSRSVWMVASGTWQHQPGDVAEDDVLLLRHLGGEQRAEDESRRAPGSSWSAARARAAVALQPLDADIEEIKGHRVFDIRRIDDADAVM
jgi:hypothetical protein